MLNPAVAAPIIGARTPAQLADNLAALDVVLPADARTRLDRASAVDLGFPHEFLTRPMVRNVIFGDANVVSG